MNATMHVMSEDDRIEVRAILRAVAGSSLRIIDPRLTEMVEDAIRLMAPADDRPQLSSNR